jgi:NAD(P)-dependent dehydrogenase (short-subunit alcohol dehydrogenase family)
MSDPRPSPSGHPAPSGRSDPSGKVALVSGATSGIGDTIATRLYSEGARLLLTGRNAARGEQLAASLGPGAHFQAADLTESGSAQALVDSCLELFGSLDILVNNAAIDHFGDLLTTPMEDVRSVFETNTFAALRLLQCAAVAMSARGGSIINITSRLASVGVANMAIYSASKGAVAALTRAAAVELAPMGIRVNGVAPGMTKTPLFDAWLASQPDPARAEYETISQIPIGRLASPDDVAAAVSYLASDDAAYITGTTIAVDGGYTAQ